MIVARKAAREAAVRNGKMPFFSSAEFLCTIRRVLAAAYHLHKHEVVHRDITPDNILVGAGGGGSGGGGDARTWSDAEVRARFAKHGKPCPILTPQTRAAFQRKLARLEAAVVAPICKLANFGASLDLQEGDFAGFQMEFRNRKLSRGGSKAYLAPEVVLAKPGVGKVIDYSKNDVFAVGMVAHNMLSGLLYPPFVGSNPKEYSSETYRPLPDMYPAEIRSLVWGMLNPDPLQRLTVADALAKVSALCGD